MNIIIVTKSKFFEEALKFILYPFIKYCVVIDDINKLGEFLSFNNYFDLILCDLDSTKQDINNITSALEEKGLKATKVVIFSFKSFQDIGSVDTVDGYIRRPLNPDTVREYILSLRNTKRFE